MSENYSELQPIPCRRCNGWGVVPSKKSDDDGPFKLLKCPKCLGGRMESKGGGVIDFRAWIIEICDAGEHMEHCEFLQGYPCDCGKWSGEILEALKGVSPSRFKRWQEGKIGDDD